MNKTTRKWVHGLAAAVIGGGSSAVSAAFGVNLVAPTTFNFQDGLGKMATLITIMFVWNAAQSAFLYLKQSPLPPDEDTPVPPPQQS